MKILSRAECFVCTAVRGASLWVSLLLGGAAFAEPAWWSNVKNSTGPVNDFKPALVGQAKNMALHAMEALDDALAPFNLPGGGAGMEIRQMVNSWRIEPENPASGWKTHDIARILNQGQLKALAKPFYDRLALLGLWDRGWIAWAPNRPAPFNVVPYTSPQWWLPAPINPADWADIPRYPWKFWVPQTHWRSAGLGELGLSHSNVGQLKHVFNFDPAQRLSAVTYQVNNVTTSFLTNGQPTDSDGDGVSDLVEFMLGSKVGVADSSVAPLGDLYEDGFSGPQQVLSDAAASRFLAQASWGPTWESIAAVKALGLEEWVDQQIEDDPFRESGQLMAYQWLDGSGSMAWQNLWFGWPDQSQAPVPLLFPQAAGSYAAIDASWPNHHNAAWRAANDPHERGPFLNPNFPKRGIEPYQFYLTWRKLMLDRPLWQGLLQSGAMPTHSMPTPLTAEQQEKLGGASDMPWPYYLSGVWANNGGFGDHATWTAYNEPFAMDDAWMRRALYDSDQLRQRVAWALSQILVVSDYQRYAAQVALTGDGSVGHYYDMLNQYAFGNFKDLLTAVTFHPLMAAWLSYKGNTVEFNPDGSEKRIPDENYAREIMQLFSIGLDELNLDGTPKLDAQGQRIPTYTQEEVRQLARVFTGLENRTAHLPVVTLPMKMNATLHDKRAKQFLGMTIAANPGADAAACEAEIRNTVAHIATLANVAPFISRQLITHLTSSSPSPGYVKRVATVFAGNALAPDQLGKVVKAILMDPEARAADQYLFNSGQGRLKDPMLRLVSLMRAFNAGRDYNHGTFDLRAATQHPLDGPLWGWGHFVSKDSEVRHLYQDLHQYPFVPPSVFSFFLPGFAPPGMVANARMKAPEFQLVSAAALTSSIGRVWFDTDANNQGPAETGFTGMIVQRQSGLYRSWLTRLYNELPVRPEGSSLDLRGKTLRLNFDSLASNGGLPAVAGTELALSPRPSGSNPTPPSQPVAEAFLAKLNVLLCHGRMSSVTHSHLLKLLMDPANPAIMENNDPWRWERAAVQLLWALPEAAVIR